MTKEKDYATIDLESEGYKMDKILMIIKLDDTSEIISVTKEEANIIQKFLELNIDNCSIEEVLKDRECKITFKEKLNIKEF